MSSTDFEMYARSPYARAQTNARRVTIALAGAILIGCPVMAPSPQMGHMVTLGAVAGLYAFRRAEIEQCLASSFDRSRDHIRQVGRDGDGSRIVCAGQFGGKDAALLVDGKEVRRIELPGVLGYLDGAGSIVAWSDNISESLTVGTTTFKPIGVGGRVEVDPGGRFFAIMREGTSVAEVRPVANPDAEPYRWSVALPDAIFAIGDRVYLLDRVGTSSIRITTVSYADSTWREEGTASIARPSPGPSPFAVYDMDPSAPRVVVGETFDPPFARTDYYLYNIATGKLDKLLLGGDYVMFLRQDVVTSCQAGAKRE